jgi:hypothetical protein
MKQLKNIITPITTTPPTPGRGGGSSLLSMNTNDTPYFTSSITTEQLINKTTPTNPQGWGSIDSHHSLSLPRD